MRGRAKDLEGGGGGGAASPTELDFSKSKHSKRSTQSLTAVACGAVCLLWLCCTESGTAGRYQAFVASCVVYGALFSQYLRKWIAKRSGGDAAMRAISQPIARGAAGFLDVQCGAVLLTPRRASLSDRPVSSSIPRRASRGQHIPRRAPQEGIIP